MTHLSDRQTEILIMLIGKTVRSQDICAKYGVSERTVYRCISKWRRQGWPILSGSGIGGGFTMRPGHLKKTDRSIPLALIEAASP